MMPVIRVVPQAYVADVKVCTQCGRLPAIEQASPLPSVQAKGEVRLRRADARKSAQCAACRSTSNEVNGNWKGGRTMHKAGYVMILVPDHSRAKRSPYAFEHILVVEEMLGRHLLPGESVHHRNGVRDDNRRENLELWTRPHPSGIRASDAIAWAIEVLGRSVTQGLGAPPTMLSCAKALVEVAGVEPASSGMSVGLLRAHPGFDLGSPPLTGGEGRPQPQ